MGVCGWASRSRLTSGAVRSRTAAGSMLGKQSMQYTAGSSSAKSSTTPESILPLPENPRLTVGRSSQRPRIAGMAIPGRDAHAPCMIDVP